MWEVVTYALTELILGEKPNEGGADGESEPTNEDDMPVFDAHEESRRQCRDDSKETRR